MSEKRFISGEIKLSYEGLFLLKPFLYKVVQWIEERGYDVAEKAYSEVVKSDHKQLHIEFEAEKEEKPKYLKYVIEIIIDLNNFQEVVVKKGEDEQKFQRGKLDLTFKGYMDSDVEGRWEGKPTGNLFRTLYEKFIVGDVMAKHEEEIKKDIGDMRYALKQHLNLYVTEKE